jgi:lipoate-protein ligase B
MWGKEFAMRFGCFTNHGTGQLILLSLLPLSRSRYASLGLEH